MLNPLWLVSTSPICQLSKLTSLSGMFGGGSIAHDPWPGQNERTSPQQTMLVPSSPGTIPDHAHWSRGMATTVCVLCVPPNPVLERPPAIAGGSCALELTEARRDVVRPPDFDGRAWPWVRKEIQLLGGTLDALRVSWRLAFASLLFARGLVRRHAGAAHILPTVCAATPGRELVGLLGVAAFGTLEHVLPWRFWPQDRR